MGHRISSYWFDRGFHRGFICLLVVLLVGTGRSGVRASTKVVPPVANGTEGNFQFGLTSALTFQNLFEVDQLNGLPAGATITGVQFRLNGGNVSSAVSATNFDLYLGPPTGATLLPTFAANEGPGTLQVRSGPYSLAAGAYPSGGSPNAFGPVIPFSAPYTFTGGALLLTASYTTFGSGLILDASNSVGGNYSQQRDGYNATTANIFVLGYALTMQLVYTVPEPASLGMVGMACTVLCCRHRKSRRRQEVLR